MNGCFTEEAKLLEVSAVALLLMSFGDWFRFCVSRFLEMMDSNPFRSKLYPSKEFNTLESNRSYKMSFD